MRRFLREELSSSECSDESSGQVFGSCQWQMMIHHGHHTKREAAEGSGVNIMIEPTNDQSHVPKPDAKLPYRP